MIIDTGLIARRVWLALELIQSPQSLGSAIWYVWEEDLLGICLFQEEELFLRFNGAKTHYRWLLNLIDYHNQFKNGDIAVNVLLGEHFQKLIQQSNPCCTVKL